MLTYTLVMTIVMRDGTIGSEVTSLNLPFVSKVTYKRNVGLVI